MKISESKVQKIQLTNLDKLDPINIYLEDNGPGYGTVTISCYNKVWRSFWGAIGKENTIKDFFLSCDNHYLSKNLAPNLRSEITDYEKIQDSFKGTEWEYEADGINCETSLAIFNADTSGAMHDVFGEEWWECLPTSENPEYKYLNRILDAVKEGLKQA